VLSLTSAENNKFTTDTTLLRPHQEDLSCTQPRSSTKTTKSETLEIRFKLNSGI